MSAQALISPAAEADIEGIVHFLSVDDPALGERFVDEALHTFEFLADAPFLGHPYQHQNRKLKGLRSWVMSPFRNYIVFYWPRRTGIEVARVLHGARDIERLLRE